MVLLPLLLVLQITASPAPATRPGADEGLGLSAHAEGSPERAYLQLLSDIRAGRYDEAYAALQPPPGRFSEMVHEGLRMYHDLESLKAEMRAKFGPDSIDELNMGFIPDKSLRTVRANVHGDTATLSFVAADTGRREDSTITMEKIDGRWRTVWHGYAVGADESVLQMSDEEIEAFMKTGEQMKRTLAEVERRLAAGEFKDPEEVQTAVIEAMMNAAKR